MIDLVRLAVTVAGTALACGVGWRLGRLYERELRGRARHA